MRGPQTTAELRARASRMMPIDSPDRLDCAARRRSSTRGLVERIPAGRGIRAERLAQRLCPDLHPLDAPLPAAVPSAGAPEEAHAPTRAALSDRIDALEARSPASSASSAPGGKARRAARRLTAAP